MHLHSILKYFQLYYRPKQTLLLNRQFWVYDQQMYTWAGSVTFTQVQRQGRLRLRKLRQFKIRVFQRGFENGWS